MSDEFGRRTSESSLGEALDSAARRIMTGLIIGGGAIALAIYSRPEPPRYEVDVMGSTVLRTDTRRGGVLACEGQDCYVLIRRGPQRGDRPPPKALPADQPEASRTLPAAEPSVSDGNAQ